MYLEHKVDCLVVEEGLYLRTDTELSGSQKVYNLSYTLVKCLLRAPLGVGPHSVQTGSHYRAMWCRKLK